MWNSRTYTSEELQAATWPVGSAVLEGNETNPADLLGFGKWKELGKLDVDGVAVYVWIREE